ncbi:MAG: ribonuclease III [Oscillospiraceae bacterium]|nr:ribonuclease III [Oscillospiraceae bacterium]
MEKLQENLGYRFRDESLLRGALYHSSYANEHRNENIVSNERLEFLGDAVLGFVSAEFLYSRFPNAPEGELTRIRAALVREESLFEVAQALQLGECLMLGKGEESGGGRQRPSILADCTEAVFAAVYLDGGMDCARDLIHRVLLSKGDIEVAESRRRDYKTELQELVQRKPHQVLRYELIGQSGPDHAKVFTVAVLLNGDPIGEGSGHSKKEAEQASARAALEKLTEE